VYDFPIDRSGLKYLFMLRFEGFYLMNYQIIHSNIYLSALNFLKYNKAFISGICVQNFDTMNFLLHHLATNLNTIIYLPNITPDIPY